eukprot:TRINITY_DN6577_c0_g1_i2.p1 TRINITY_DN6577_c0_g1~~TRINITY_DN6577_c0_g1_i2.p1  ORF type:complete len:378 (+),score=24.93 TRINITY_DN6577_c0_g1_i2:40-1134(+)
MAAPFLLSSEIQRWIPPFLPLQKSLVQRTTSSAQTRKRSFITFPKTCNRFLNLNILISVLESKRLATSSKIAEPAQQQNDLQMALATGEAKLIFEKQSEHNFIRVIDICRSAYSPLAGARLLLLHKPGNIHSIYYKFKTLTNTYFDILATIPPILPAKDGQADLCLGILGMGAGTAARVLFHFWPSLQVHGWEIDPEVVEIGRRFFALAELEREQKGRLVVHIGDALEEAAFAGSFSGIMVDLFNEGCVIRELQEPAVWERLRKRLKKGGRIVVNCGGRFVESEKSCRNGQTLMEETLSALSVVFAGKVSVLRMTSEECEDSCIAVTGCLPDFGLWKRSLPPPLAAFVHQWVPLQSFQRSQKVY